MPPCTAVCVLPNWRSFDCESDFQSKLGTFLPLENTAALIDYLNPPKLGDFNTADWWP